MAKKKCKHLHEDRSYLTYHRPSVGRPGPGHLGYPVVDRCTACGEYLSLGEGNDEPIEVQTEIDAAECAAHVGRLSHVGWAGWNAHVTGSDIDAARSQEAGWLAHEMVTHESAGRDDGAWSWDPTRPVAGQYEEYLERMRIAEAACAEPEPFDVESAAFLCGDAPPAMLDAGEVIAEQTRHDVAASVVRHAKFAECAACGRRPSEPCDFGSLCLRTVQSP